MGRGRPEVIKEIRMIAVGYVTHSVSNKRLCIDAVRALQNLKYIKTTSVTVDMPDRGCELPKLTVKKSKGD